MNNQRWFRKAGGHYQTGIVRDVLLKYLLSLLAWAVGVGVLGLFCWDFFGGFSWRGSGVVYAIFTFFRDYFLWTYGIATVTGWIALSYRFISRPLRYLDELVNAAGELAAPGNEPIKLPKEMHEVENQLNLVREQALRSALAAREAEQRKNDLIVYLAHDLKTPLTSVVGYLTLLRDEPQISQELRLRYTQTALDKADRLEELINEFFEITRFNLTQVELERAPVDLTRMLQQLVSEFEPILRDKELTCEAELPSRLEYVCDPDKLARVFDNLLRNAVSYSFPHSVIHIQAEQKRDKVLITFQNVGSTIPQDKLNRIFEQFFRLDSSRASRTGGAGLGLAIAKQLVGLHGGTIAAESADSCTCFRIMLPLKSG